MKSKTAKLLSILLALVMMAGLLPLGQVVYAAGDVAIDATNFPDPNFREFVKTYDTDSNGYLSETEIAAVGSMNCSSKNIADLTGIEHFTALLKLGCYGNNLTALDVSENTALEQLDCYGNNLTALDVSENTALEQLDCRGNNLTALDVSENTALLKLDCRGNNLTALDVSENTALEHLNCSNNQLTALDVSKNINLWILYCSNNQLTELDVSKNINQWQIECNNNNLTALDVSKNTDLKMLICRNNQLTELDVNTELASLICRDNHLISLDVSACTTLRTLYCNNNQLTELDVSNNTELEALYCYGNNLTTLDVSNNTELEVLYCYGNNLTTLDVSEVSALKDAVENGTKDTSYSEYDKYSSSQGGLYVDKTVDIITEATYTVTVMNDGNGTGVATPASGVSGTEVTLTATPNTGYQFKEWQVVSGGVTVTDDKLTIGTENVEVKAIFELVPPTTYTVTFKDGENTLSTATVNSGEKVTKPADPTKSGYTFNGWYADSTFNAAFDFDQPITADTTVYAKFTEDVVTPPTTVTYTVTGGGNSTWTKGSSAAVTITVKRSEDDANCLKHFQAVEIDGTALAASDYEAKSGSTVVTIKAAALEKLSAGKHTVTVKFDDGSVGTSLTVKAASGSADKPTSPNTGDESNMGLWMTLAALSMAGLAGIATVGRKRRVHR